MTSTRRLSSVPGWIAWVFGATLALQLSSQALSGGDAARTTDLPPAPSTRSLTAASLGERELAARAAMIYLQAFDLRGDNALRYAELDYGRLADWLRTIQATDPRSSYALFSAARVYAEVADPGKCRVMLDFLYEAFRADPERRWTWLVQAALVAKHRLKDLPRALLYARAIERHAGTAAAPLWARQMQAFVLEDMNELEAARIVLGGLIASGLATDPAELRFLLARTQALEQRLAAR